MEDNKTLDQATSQGTETKPQGEGQANDLEARLAEIEKKYKSEIAGLNRKVSETEKKARELELEKLSEEEKLKKILEDQKNEIAQNEKIKRDLLIGNKLLSAGLQPEKYAKRVIGMTEDEIENDILELKNLLKSDAELLAEKKINEKLSGKTPEAGASISEMTRAQFEALDPISRMDIMKSIKSGTTKLKD